MRRFLSNYFDLLLLLLYGLLSTFDQTANLIHSPRLPASFSVLSLVIALRANDVTTNVIMISRTDKSRRNIIHCYLRLTRSLTALANVTVAESAQTARFNSKLFVTRYVLMAHDVQLSSATHTDRTALSAGVNVHLLRAHISHNLQVSTYRPSKSTATGVLGNNFRGRGRGLHRLFYQLGAGQHIWGYVLPGPTPPYNRPCS